MKLKNIVLIIILLAGAACSNEDWEFPDYDVQGCYFPYQTPARTLILGNYDQGINENDNNHRFEITAVLTGIYENDIQRKIYFEIDNDLIKNAANIKALPVDYYTIEGLSPAMIPQGSNKAKITVQLHDQFFDDELAFGASKTTNYVIPIRMTKAENIDSIYTGIPFSDVISPDRLNPNHWDSPAKDYTLFGIKFMNRFHGKYLRRGLDQITSGTPYVGREYNEEFTESDELIFVETCGRDKVHLNNIIGRGDNNSPGMVALELDFNDDNSCTVSSYGEDTYNVSGKGKWVEGGDIWGGKPRDVIFLDYTYTDETNAETHAVKDTIVIRDRAAIFEEFEVTLNEEE